MADAEKRMRVSLGHAAPELLADLDHCPTRSRRGDRILYLARLGLLFEQSVRVSTAPSQVAPSAVGKLGTDELPAALVEPVVSVITEQSGLREENLAFLARSFEHPLAD